MPYALKASVLHEIERTFAPEHVEYVRRKLSERQLPMDRSAPPPRVHIAVLWLARGDIKRFDCELEGACCDWRDTLVAAGLANEDWRTVLIQRGIDCDDW
jgi:hypothetical protein